LADGILNRLLRFVHVYPVDTSLHQDFLIAVAATLSHLALNRRDAVTRFARGIWHGLVDMWGTKNKGIKETLVVILRVLFPFYTASDPNQDSSASVFDYTDGVSRLWQLLDNEADNRWGMESLSIDSLRLQLLSPPETQTKGQARSFITRTFQYGWNFDAGQALAWATLELQADCVEKVCFSNESSFYSSSLSPCHSSS